MSFDRVTLVDLFQVIAFVGLVSWVVISIIQLLICYN